MLTYKQLENELAEIFSKCETTLQITAVSKRINNMTHRLTKARKLKIATAIAQKLDEFLSDSIEETDTNFRSVFECIHDFSIAIENM